MEEYPMDVAKACKFDFEYLGFSLSEVAKRYNMPMQLLLDISTQENWTPKVDLIGVAPADAGCKAITEYVDELTEVTRARLTVGALLRQVDNQALYAQIERTCLERALQMAEALDPMDDKGTQKLANIVSAIEVLSNQNPLVLADQLKMALKSEASNGSGAMVQVNVVSKL